MAEPRTALTGRWDFVSLPAALEPDVRSATCRAVGEHCTEADTGVPSPEPAAEGLAEVATGLVLGGWGALAAAPHWEGLV